ncbi:MAG: competence/damage-inducible protein A [Clostridiales bacterium]|jgi:nicotinamide-nucleotide amidase|nr:competence/damage-inducible protein A [Clostridiales bacterium]
MRRSEGSLLATIAEILAVGTELLLGDILNTNAQFLSRELAKLGINVYYQTVVGDNPARLLEAYKTAFGRADVVIATGGLGPTEDDLTKETAALYFGKELALDEESWEMIAAFFRKMHANMAPTNKKQAMMPIGSSVLKNRNGTAPGCFIEEGGKMLFLLPGPPNEAQPMYLNEVAPILRPRTERMFVSKTLKICGIGESQAEEMLKDLIDAQGNPSIAPYAKTSEVWFRITASAKNEGEAAELMKPTLDEIKKRLGRNIYGEDDESLVSVTAMLLMEKGLTLSAAESCTGGELSARLVDFPGISSVFLEGAVTYSNEAKIRRLGVKAATLEKYGAVSPQTAVEMAGGIARTSGSDIGISTTGIAGPDGGTPEKPVGLVYLGLSVKGEASVKELNLAGNRAKVRTRAVVSALDMIRRALLS